MFQISANILKLGGYATDKNKYINHINKKKNIANNLYLIPLGDIIMILKIIHQEL